MTGYEQSPDYGDPKHARQADLLLALTALIIIVIAVLVIFFG